MKRHTCRMAAMLSLAMTMGCSAATRIADAVVTEHERQPCFGTGHASSMRRLQAVIVSDVSKTPAVTLWETTVDGAAFDRSARQCVSYGERSSAIGNAERDPPKLQPGRIYHVFLNVRRENPADPTYGYEAEFCLKEGAAPQNGVVHQILWDKQLRRKLREACHAGK
jgi:hypothetical protein